ncbi:MAG: Ig-like domain-containing protein [Ruminococcus sp.]|nr:Ig-like domain-containing protein [Ruminococcus sp.]
MNILIVADKSDIKTYENVIKSAPNTSVLGAVTTVNLSFISELKDKWHPHMVIIDTEVPTKKINIIDVINNINTLYPYIKIVVLTDDEDNYSYPAYAVIRGQVSSIEFKALIKNAISEVNHGLFLESGKTEELANKSENNISYLDTGSDITEKLSNKNEHMDKLSIDAPKIEIPKIRKNNRRTSNRMIYIAFIGLTVLITIIVVCIVLNSCNSAHSSATSDEVPTQATHLIEPIEVPSEEGTTDSELVISFTDPSIMESVIIDDDNTVATVPRSESYNSTSSNNSNSTSVSSSSVNKTPNSDNKTNNSHSSSSTSSNSSTNSKVENSDNNNYSSQGSVSVSQNNNKYSNSNTNRVQSIKLNYSQKTLTVDEYITISATVSPATANYTLNYSSSNTSVCTVSSSGTVTAKKAGTATITATADGKSTTCKIIVNPKPISHPTSPPTTADPVKLSYTNYTIVSGQTFTLQLYNASSVSWHINYPSIITTTGGSATQINIKGLKSGTATITATNNSTGKQYTCMVTVK